MVMSLRPTFLAHRVLSLNQVVTLTRVTNERVMQLGLLVAGQVSSVHVL